MGGLLFRNAALLDVEAGETRPGAWVRTEGERIVEVEDRELSIRAEVLPPAEVLRQATRVNAEILGREGELGVVAPGALADLLLVDGDPLRDLAVLQGQGKHLHAVVRGGELLVDRLDA